MSQSNENIPLDESFSIDVVAVGQPTGSGNPLQVLDYTKDTSVKVLLLLGQAIADSHPKIKQVKLGKCIQKTLALELYKKANVLPGPCDLREISKFQGVLPGYQIIVIDFNARNTSIYEGPRRDRKIVIYKNGDHYDVINPKKLPAFHGKRFYCEKCTSFYTDFSSHPCLDPCHTCLRKECVGFRRRNVRVPTVLSFVAPLHVLIITKNHVSLEGVTFRQNATRRLDVNCVQLLSNVNEETFIAVVNMYVGFVKNMCCLIICATCNLKRLRHRVTNLFFTTLRLTFQQMNMW